MTSKQPKGRDFVGVSDRFRPGPDSAPPERRLSGSFQYTPDSVRNTQPLLRYQLQNRLKTTLPKVLTLIAGAVLTLVGLYNTAGILSLRGSQHSLVNNLLLVFTGSFLVFLAVHERHVERAHRGTP